MHFEYFMAWFFINVTGVLDQYCGEAQVLISGNDIDSLLGSGKAVVNMALQPK